MIILSTQANFALLFSSISIISLFLMVYLIRKGSTSPLHDLGVVEMDEFADFKVSDHLTEGPCKKRFEEIQAKIFHLSDVEVTDLDMLRLTQYKKRVSHVNDELTFLGTSDSVTLTENEIKVQRFLLNNLEVILGDINSRETFLTKSGKDASSQTQPSFA